MNLKAKPYEQSHKQSAQDQLAALKSTLETKGLSPKDIQRDARIKKLSADIRKANRRLAAIASQEQLQETKKSAKTEKLAAQKEAKAPAKEKASKKGTDKEGKKDKKPKEKKKNKE